MILLKIAPTTITRLLFILYVYLQVVDFLVHIHYVSYEKYHLILKKQRYSFFANFHIFECCISCKEDFRLQLCIKFMIIMGKVFYNHNKGFYFNFHLKINSILSRDTFTKPPSPCDI